MCGRYSLVESPVVKALMSSVGLADTVNLRFSQDCAPGNLVSIIVEESGERRVKDAIWHLYLNYLNGEWKLDKRYWSINSRYDKLPKKWEYRHSRCLIPATAFVESQKGRAPHLLEFGKAFVFGGLKKEWHDQESGSSATSTSIITLPGHDKLVNIHESAFPLILDDEDKHTIDAWLDPGFQDIRAFDDLLKPRIRWNMKATPINKASQKIPAGESFKIAAD